MISGIEPACHVGSPGLIPSTAKRKINLPARRDPLTLEDGLGEVYALVPHPLLLISGSGLSCLKFCVASVSHLAPTGEVPFCFQFLF